MNQVPSLRQASHAVVAALTSASGEPLLHHLVERGIGPGRPGCGAPQPGPPRLAGHELPLGENGALVPPDVLDRHAGLGRDVLRGPAGTDLGLDVARTHRARLLDLQLGQPRPVAPDGGAQRFVDPQQVALAVLAGQHEVLPVVVDADEREVVHE